MSIIYTKIAQSQVKKMQELAKTIALYTNTKYEDVYQDLRKQLLNNELDLWNLEELKR